MTPATTFEGVEASVLPPLKLTHFHVKVVDIEATLAWFWRMCGVKPAFQNAKLAYLTLGPVTLVLEPGPNDTETTIAFGTTDCDRDFATLVSRGASPIAAPVSQPWGVRGAYLEGPAGITFELEQRLETAPKTTSNSVSPS
jgi:catechol 2,3-dioxygenase-like lactoylglutathione lyase family enzyme